MQIFSTKLLLDCECLKMKVNMYVGTGIIYLCVLLLSSLVAYFSERYNYNRALVFLCFILLVAFWSIRYGIGHDYMSYVRLFQEIKCGDGDYIEPGYRYINTWFANYPLGYVGVMFVMSILFFFFLFKAFIYEKIFALGVFFAMTLHLEFFLMNGVRQGVVVCMFLYLIHFFEQKRYWVYVLGLLCASMFHASAWLLLLLFLVPKIKFKNIFYYVLIIAAYIVYLTGFFKNLGTYLLLNMPFYENYQLNEARMLAEENGFSIVMLLWVFVGLYIIYRSDAINRPLILNAYIMGLVLYIAFNDFHLIYRFTIPWIFLNALLFPLAVKSSLKNKYLIVAIFGILFALTVFKGSSSQGVFPYETIFTTSPMKIF